MNAWAKHFIPTSKGFTIVELLIVIVVIGILATVGLFGYGAVQNNAQDTAFKAELTRIGDEIKLVTLDNNGVPTGGATSSLTGDSTTLNLVNVSPNEEVYDLTSLNLFYCAGDIGGNEEFAVVAKSTRGAVFYYRSDTSIAQLPNDTEMTYGSVCPAAGFSDPYTWSYGYNPSPEYGWFAWAYDGPLITNLITNPSIESSTSGWTNYVGLGTPTRTSTDPWIGDWRLSAVGDGTSLTPRVRFTDVASVTGEKISLSFRVRSDGQTPTDAYIAIKLTAGGSEVSTFHTVDIPWEPDSNDWVRATTTFTVPSGGEALRITLGLRSVTNYTGTIGIDGALLVKGMDTVPGYADGNSTDWVWNGTADASTSTGPPKP
jgi:prepilin-type N-terminal cleavage/methylation domain-containing protein